MPNPLLSARPRVTSKPPPSDLAVTPVPEEYEGDNNPYRGTQQHGVEPTADPRPTPGWSEGRPVMYDPPMEEPEPLPVVIRSQHGRELRRSRHTHTYAPANTANPRQVVGRDEDRTKVIIINLSSQRVWVGDTPETATSMHGWPLEADAANTYESTTQDALYALSSDASQHELAVRVEYSVEA